MGETRNVPRHGLGRRLTAGVTAAVLSATGLTALAAPQAQAADLPAPVLSYTFDGGTSGALANGATVADQAGSYPGTIINAGSSLTTGLSGQAGDLALQLPGGNAGTASAHLQIAPGVLNSSSTDVTISGWLKWQSDAGCTWPMSLGSSNAQYVFFTPSCGNTAIGAVKSGSTERRATYSAKMDRDRWVHVAVVLKGGQTITQYLDGVQVAQNTTTFNASAAVGTSAFSGYLGRSFYSADPFYTGLIDEFTVYNQALTGEQVIASATASDGGATIFLQRDLDSLQVPGYATADLTLPTQGTVADISWASDKPGVISPAGVVVRGSADEVVTLTATLTHDSTTLTKNFTVTVPGSSPSQTLASVVIPSVLTVGDVLPTGSSAQPVSWEVVSGDVTLDGATIATAPAEEISDVTLKATLAGAQPRTIEARVLGGDVATLATYTTTNTTRGTVDPEVTRSAHFALSTGGAFEALNSGAGVVFAQVTGMTESSNGTKRYLADPYLFRLAGDEGFGLIAQRVNSTGAVVAADQGSALIFTSPDLTQWTQLGMLPLGAAGTITDLAAEWDEAAAAYKVMWTDAGGMSLQVSSPDLQTVTATGEALRAPARTANPQVSFSQQVRALPLTASEAKTLSDALARVRNTTVDAPEAVEVPVNGELALPEKVTANYSDGGTHDFRVDWNTSNVDLSTPGTYQATGTLQEFRTRYPMIARRADPHVLRYELADGTKTWLFISTDDNGQDEFFIRSSATIEGIQSAPDNRILGLGLSGSAPVGSQLWAPELHVVNGDLYILFAANANNVNNWAGVQSYTMRLKTGGNPLLAADWETPQRVVDQAGQPLTQYGSGITLDMTHFEDDGKDYVMWSERKVSPTYPAVLKIATVDVSTTGPWKLSSERSTVRFPDFGWDVNDAEVAEGPFAIQRDGKIMITYSGSSVSYSYVVGVMTAESGADLLDPAAWTVTSHPIWHYEGAHTNNWGPGHNSYTYDDDGNLINVFHAMATQSGTRDAGLRMVYFRQNGLPILDMLDTEWLLAANRTVSVTVTVTDDAPSPTVAVTATTRCVAGKVVLAASVTNESDSALSFGITSPYGSKQVTSLAAGATTSAAFSTRQTSISGGSVSVTVGETTVSGTYGSASCG
ncbi:MAG TPA: family 43 glycosylhydrolase [Arachnia sp.]|nr:family 43 glycosylhydrolase [Arachnia sp.]HMT87240.1 family 43 glycosylhydrolase [Arachnia sp.]